MSKKYKLKRDLPTFKAGTILEISNKGNLVGRGDLISDSIQVLDKYTIGRFPDILNNSDWFEEIPEEPKTVWDLEKWEAYYYIDTDGRVMYDYWIDTLTDHARREIGAFLTRDEAEKEVARRKAKQVLLRDTKGYKPVWDGTHSNYEVWFGSISSCLGVSNYSTVFTHHDLWFASKEDAMASIKEHEKEWKIYLGVEG